MDSLTKLFANVVAFFFAKLATCNIAHNLFSLCFFSFEYRNFLSDYLLSKQNLGQFGNVSNVKLFTNLNVLDPLGLSCASLGFEFSKLDECSEAL